MKRKEMLPKYCSRCGNDFMNGQKVIYLPFLAIYISLCSICCEGLDISFEEAHKTMDQWNKFWEEEVK